MGLIAHVLPSLPYVGTKDAISTAVAPGDFAVGKGDFAVVAVLSMPKSKCLCKIFYLSMGEGTCTTNFASIHAKSCPSI